MLQFDIEALTQHFIFSTPPSMLIVRTLPLSLQMPQLLCEIEILLRHYQDPFYREKLVHHPLVVNLKGVHSLSRARPNSAILDSGNLCTVIFVLCDPPSGAVLDLGRH